MEGMKAKARLLRRHIIEMTAEAGSGHPGGSLSSADIVAALYFKVLRHDPRNPHWPDRDRFILSKGHAAPLLYAALARWQPDNDTFWDALAEMVQRWG